PKIDEKAQFELKGQFLKELRDNTFSGSDNEDENEHIEKVLEIVDLFHIPNITQDQETLMEEINNFQQDPDETLYQALSLKERMELNLEARLMGKALILNRSLDPLYGDYIELNDLNKPLDLKRNQVDDLEPTIKEGEVVDEPMIDIVKTRCDNEIVDGLDEYPSYCDFDRKIHINCAFNL
ncbi:hypothetical protein Tco_1356237, partial [Tanacetum coccineum]